MGSEEEVGVGAQEGGEGRPLQGAAEGQAMGVKEHKIVDLKGLPTMLSLQSAAAELHSIIVEPETGAADAPEQGTISSLSAVAARVNEYTHHEQRQVETQKKLIHDLMRCVAENHEYIALQHAQLEENTAEIGQLKKLLGGADGEFSLAKLPGRLNTIEDELAALRALMDRTPPAMDDELRAIKQKFHLMEQAQAKHTEDIGKAWGYIMADEAAEDIANTVDGEELDDVDEAYAKLTAKALAIASNQTTTKLKQAFGTDKGIAIDSAFWRWATWADDMKQEREEHELREAAEKKAKEEAEEEARLAAADDAERQRILFEKEEAKRDAEELVIAKASGEEWTAVRDAELALSVAQKQLAGATTDEERILAKTAIAAAKERVQRETEKAEAGVELKKAERALARASTPEQRAAAEAAVSAAKAKQDITAAAAAELTVSHSAMRTTLKAKIKLMGKLSLAREKQQKGEEAARRAAERERKALEATQSVSEAQGAGSVEQEKMEDKVHRKLDQKKREAQMAKDVEYLMRQVPEMQRQFADEQVVQDEALLDSSNQLQKLQSESDKLQAELKACMSMCTATSEGMAKLQSSVDRLDASAKNAGHVPSDFADRFAKMESLLDAFSGLSELRGQIDDHSERLAEIFTRKASKDDLDAMKTSLKGMGDSFAAQLAKAAGEIVADLNETKAGMEGQLSGLFAQMGGKVDTLWVDDLERQLRSEIDRLSRLGKNTIDMDALDAKLAALRAALKAELHKQEDEASGSAAFRCLLYDRPLPPKEDWRLKQRSELSASIPHNHEEIERGYGAEIASGAGGSMGGGGTGAGIGVGSHGSTTQMSFAGPREHEESSVVYRAGFPTVGRPSSKGSVGLGGLNDHDLSISSVASAATPGAYGAFAPMASSWGQRGMVDSRSGRNLPPVATDASGRPVEVMRSGRAHAKGDRGVMRAGHSSLDNSTMRLDGQGPALPGFEPWGGQHAGQQRPRTSGAY